VKAIIAVAIALAALAPAFGEAPAQVGAAPAQVGAKELIDRPYEFDGKTVIFQGEAIGEAMRRGKWTWANVLDSYAAIGVFAPSGVLESVSAYGSSKAKGDIVRVVGTFRRACPDHGGDMDIHAESIDVVERGKPTPQPADPFVLALTPVSFVLAALCFFLWRKRKAAIGFAGRRVGRSGSR